MIIAIKPIGTWRVKQQFAPFVTALKQTLNSYDGLNCLTLPDHKDCGGYDLNIEVRCEPFQWADFILTCPLNAHTFIEDDIVDTVIKAFPQLNDVRLMESNINKDYGTNNFLRFDLTHHLEYNEKMKPIERDLGRVIGITLARSLGFEKRR